MPNLNWRGANTNEDLSDCDFEVDIRSGDSDPADQTYWEYLLNAGEGNIDWFTGSDFDSGERSFTLTLNPGGGQGGASFVVAPDGSLAEDPNLTYGDITKVAIDVRSTVGAIELKDVVVTCFVRNLPNPSVPHPSNPTCIVARAMMQQNAPAVIVPPLSCVNPDPRFLDCPADTEKIVMIGKVRLAAQAQPDISDLRVYIAIWNT